MRKFSKAWLLAGAVTAAASLVAHQALAQDGSGAPAPNAGGGVVKCNTTPSGAKSIMCGTSTDSAHWWNAMGIGTMMSLGNTSLRQLKPTFFPPDVAFTHYAIPKGDEKYAVLSGERIKKYIWEITAISRKSRDDGNQYWGRLTGSKYDHMTDDYVAAQLKRVGVQGVHIQQFKLPPQWWPTHWEVSVSAGGKTVKLESAWPHSVQPCSARDCSMAAKGTEGKTWNLQPVWVGLGTPLDFKEHDVKGKAVIIYSIATPGGEGYSAGWSGAVQRARDAGAAVVFTVLGFPGNHVNHGGGTEESPQLTFGLGMDDSNTIREMMEKGEKPVVHVNESVELRAGLTTGSVWGTLPGMTNENIVIMAHTEAPLQGAMDNASGIGGMIELAQYYASLPKEQRKRTITFLTTSAHHTPAPNDGIQWVRKHYDFSKTAVILNCEHLASFMFDFVGSSLVGTNVIAPRRWYMQGSDELKALVTKTFVDYGVGVDTPPSPNSGGELGQLKGLAPGFHILDDIGYHTDMDIPQYVPVAGLESVIRAYAKIVDGINTMPLSALRKNMGEPVKNRWTDAIEAMDPGTIPVPK